MLNSLVAMGGEFGYCLIFQGFCGGYDSAWGTCKGIL